MKKICIVIVFTMALCMSMSVPSFAGPEDIRLSYDP